MELSWLTITAIAFIALSAIHGAIKGIHKNLVNLIFIWGVILTFIFGFSYAYELADSFTDNEIVRTLIAAIGLLIAAMAIFGVIAELVDKSQLNQLIGARLNYGLGLVYGIVRGIFLIVIAWLIFTSLASENIVKRVRVMVPYTVLDTLSDSLVELMPDTWTEKADEIKVQVIRQTQSNNPMVLQAKKQLENLHSDSPSVKN